MSYCRCPSFLRLCSPYTYAKSQNKDHIFVTLMFRETGFRRTLSNKTQTESFQQLNRVFSDSSRWQQQYEHRKENSVSNFPEKVKTNTISLVLSLLAVGGPTSSKIAKKTSDRIIADHYLQRFKDFHKPGFAGSSNTSHQNSCEIAIEESHLENDKILGTHFFSLKHSAFSNKDG